MLEEVDAEVRDTDLYQDGFSAVAGRGDFVNFPRDRPLRLLEAQKASYSHGGLSADILAEQEKLVWCDLVLLQFPIWWGTYPAILKGWIERVLTYGFAYGREQRLPPKAVLFSVTTGGAETSEEALEYRERVSGMADDVFGYMGWDIREPFIAHGPDSLSDGERKLAIAEYEAFLRRSLTHREESS